MSFRFHGKRFTFTQPDGTKFEVRGWGDQHHAVFESLDGYTVVLDPESGYYQLAVLDEEADDLAPSGARADRFDGAALNLNAGLRISGAASRERGMRAHQLMTGRRRCEVRRKQRQNRARAFADATIGAAPGGPATAPPQRQTLGDFLGLCLLIEFPDTPAVITRQQVDDFCNMEGYSEFGNNGSVYDYFHSNSNSLFRYKNVVTAYYMAKYPKSYYTNPTIEFGTRARQLIKEALDDLALSGFDFDQLTADEEGYVYAMNIFYAGVVENNWSQGLWPHSWSLASEYDLGGGRKAFDYQFTAIGNELDLGTFCHENGHMVCDYPDLYDYGYESNGVGAFCLMSSGGPDEKNPTQVSAYLKYKSGWDTALTTITHDGELSLPSAGSEFAIHRRSDTEYFLLENRNQTGRDASLPAAGLLIWHVDELGSNNNEVGTEAVHYELSVEQADGAMDLEKKQNNGDAGDLFHGAAVDRFADATSPNSRWWDGSSSNLDVHGVSSIGPILHFKTRLYASVGSGGSFHGSSVAEKPIPDRSAVGVTDTITFNENATVSSLEVTLDIDHSYRGDLIVTLFSPSGTAVVLHKRYQGGSADDLKRTYDASNTPMLSSFAGESLGGDWVLQVQDMASFDTGILNRWEITAIGQPSTTVALEESPGTKIPDNAAGIVRELETAENGTLVGLEVAIDITHTFIRDLIVTLESPTGTAVDLHKRVGGSADNIAQIYTLTSTPDLGSIVGEQLQGVWKLRVSDNEGADTGKLNRWSLKLKR